jgi:hypothetical protein
MTAILLSAAVAAGCGSANASKTVGAGTTPTTAPSTTASAAPASITAPAPATSTTICPFSVTPGTPATVPVDEVCSATGAPHFGSPDAAMDYLATAWNSDNVQEIDYVTDPAGRAQLDSMATLMVNLQFTSCTENPAGDYTCYFTHDITPSTSPTTYPNPGGYPPGEAVFTVAPADGPGWYLTEVVHCG